TGRDIWTSRFLSSAQQQTRLGDGVEGTGDDDPGALGRNAVGEVDGFHQSGVDVGGGDDRILVDPLAGRLGELVDRQRPSAQGLADDEDVGTAVQLFEHPVDVLVPEHRQHHDHVVEVEGLLEGLGEYVCGVGVVRSVDDHAGAGAHEFG